MRLLTTRTKLLVAVSIVTLVSCQQHPQIKANISRANKSQLDANNLSTKISDNWSVGCQKDQKDAYGKLVEKSKCWASLTDFKSSLKGLSHGVGSIFIIDAKGPHIVMQPKLSPEVCGHRTPRKKAVDGKRIDQLSLNQQISAIRNGTIYIRETNRGWPYCNLNNTVAHVSGANEAYLAMIQMWGQKDLFN